MICGMIFGWRCAPPDSTLTVARRLPLIVLLLLLGWMFWSSPTLAGIASGVAVFLFGMMALEQGLRGLTGGTLEALLRRSTDRLWKGLAFGAGTTALTQSSTLVSLLTISFLSSGLLGLKQGLGVIFGANLGTTTGAWLLAGPALHFNIGAGALPLLTFGVVFILTRNRILRALGWVLVGIGFLFLGIQWMKEGFETFQQAFDLTEFAMTGLGGLLLYTLVGIVATVIMQSSHATLIIVITALAAGQISYDNALAVSIGANIGTAVSTGLAAITTNIAGRRLAAAHLIFNLVTGLIALVFIQGFLCAVELGSRWLGIAEDNYTIRLALFHTLFNLTGIAVMVPMIGRLVHLLETKMKPAEVKLDRPKYISDQMLETPGAALEALRRELLRLFRRAFSLIARILNYEAGELRQANRHDTVAQPPARVHVVDVDKVYLGTIKPLHGLIVAFMARLPVEGVRARQMTLLRVASQDLIEAVKDAKHLQKNMVRYLQSEQEAMRNEYLDMRRNLGHLLARLDELAAVEEPYEDMELELSELGTRIEENDIVNNGRLDELIRNNRITAEQATSLMNDNAYSYRISRNLLGMARATFQPFAQLDAELRDAIELNPAEVRTLLAEIGNRQVEEHQVEEQRKEP